MIRWALQQRGMILMIVAHWVVLAVGVGIGVASSNGQIPWRLVLPYWQEVSNILAVNIGALFVLVVVNLMTAGIGGLVLLFVNGLVFGDMLGKVSEAKVVYLLWYAPLEFSAFVTAACAACRAFLVGLLWLQRVELPLIQREASLLCTVLCVVIVTLMLTAMLEAMAIQEAWGSA